MLERYDGKRVRVTTTDGVVFKGEAETFPSGYALHEFDRQEECIRVEDIHILLSQIAKIEEMDTEENLPPDHFQDLIGKLIDGPYWILDFLPEQVPMGAGGQYFAVERYYLQSEHLRELRKRYAETMLKLNCYYDMYISFDGGITWEKNPDPEQFVWKVMALSGNDFLRCMFPEEETMVDLDNVDTVMTVYDPSPAVLEKLQKLAGAAGFFVWQSEC